MPILQSEHLSMDLHVPQKLKAVLKVMLPILLSWPTASKADAGGMTVEVEPSL